MTTSEGVCRTQEEGRRRRTRPIVATIGKLNEKIIQEKNVSNKRKLKKFSPIYEQKGRRVPNTSSS